MNYIICKLMPARELASSVYKLMRCARIKNVHSQFFLNFFTVKLGDEKSRVSNLNVASVCFCSCCHP